MEIPNLLSIKMKFDPGGALASGIVAPGGPP